MKLNIIYISIFILSLSCVLCENKLKCDSLIMPNKEYNLAAQNNEFEELPKSVYQCYIADTNANIHLPTQPTPEDVEKSWTLYKSWYNKEYESEEEEEYRFNLFEATFYNVLKHNLHSGKTWTKRINKFSDITFEEFKQTHLFQQDNTNGSPQYCSATHGKNEQEVNLQLDNIFVPESKDWRDDNAVSEVKDQGNCGSCWTFSTTGCLESAHYLKTGEMVLLSEQNLVDCAQDFNNNGCSGGLPAQAFEYIRYNGGIDTEESYPYEGVDDTCKFNADNVGATVEHVYNVTAGNEHQMQVIVGLFNPLSVAFEVYGDFKDYDGGVYYSDECSQDPDQVNHAVLAVGYQQDTTEYGVPYWIVKNSWGTDWGLDGYFNIVMGENTCGIADCASFPIV